MLREHSKTVAALLRPFDLLMLASAWPAAHLVEHSLGLTGGPPDLPEVPLLIGVVTLLAWVGLSALFGLYGSRRREGLARELAAVGKSIGLVALLGLSCAFVWSAEVSPLPIGGFYALAFLFIATSRVVLRQLAHAVRRRGYNARYYAVVGTGKHAEQVVEWIASRPEWGCSFLGYVQEAGAPAESRGGVLGQLDDLPRLFQDHVIDEVYFAVEHQQMERIQPAVRLCQEQGVSVRISLGSFGDGTSQMTVVDAGGWPMLSFTGTPTNELALTAKRILDVVASAVLLLLLAPVLAAIAVATKRDSPGPVFFRQRRVGLNGREFTFFKFRSMRVGAEAELAQLRAQNEMDGPVFKMQKDPRITRVGQFLRKTSLDELPQFWNVLRGEMSLVGPRPPLPAEVRQYKPWQRRRLSVKPGITCTWQVSGRNEIDFERWMRLDLEYIDRWSFWGDVRICFQTIPAVLFAHGAR